MYNMYNILIKVQNILKSYKYNCSKRDILSFITFNFVLISQGILISL